MGVLPLCFEEGTSWQSLGLKGDEQVTIRGLHGELKPRQRMMAEIVAADGGLKRVPLICRIDTLDELDYFKNGGILQYVLRHLARDPEKLQTSWLKSCDRRKRPFRPVTHREVSGG